MSGPSPSNKKLTDRIAQEVHHGVGEAVRAANADHDGAGDVVHGNEICSRFQRVADGQLLDVIRIDARSLGDAPLSDIVSAVFSDRTRKRAPFQGVISSSSHCRGSHGNALRNVIGGNGAWERQRIFLGGKINRTGVSRTVGCDTACPPPSASVP